MAPTHLDFAPGMAKAFLYPRPGCVLKVPSSAPQPIVLQDATICIYIDICVHRAALWRKGDELIVCYGPPKRGLLAVMQTLSWWIVDAINIYFEPSQLPSLLRVRAHSTLSVAASKDFLAGVPILDICNAAGWSTPLTFVRFYGLDMRATPSCSVLSPLLCS